MLDTFVERCEADEKQRALKDIDVLAKVEEQRLKALSDLAEKTKREKQAKQRIEDEKKRKSRISSQKYRDRIKKAQSKKATAEEMDEVEPKSDEKIVVNFGAVKPKQIMETINPEQISEAVKPQQTVEPAIKPEQTVEVIADPGQRSKVTDSKQKICHVENANFVNGILDPVCMVDVVLDPKTKRRLATQRSRAKKKALAVALSLSWVNDDENGDT